jgi:flagellin
VAGAQSVLSLLDTAIRGVAIQRANVGASQNRLVTTVDNLGIAFNNLSAANSRILDADVAEETAAMTRNNILLQAGISVLAQANTQPEAALQLLRG